MADDPTQHALDVVAHQVLWDLIRRIIPLQPPMDYSHDQANCEDYPALSEDDFDKVVGKARAIARSLAPRADLFDAAYEHLAARAKDVQP